MSPRSSSSGGGSSAYPPLSAPPRSSAGVRSSYTAGTYNPSRSAISRSPSPSAQSRQYPSSRRSSSSSPRRANSYTGAGAGGVGSSTTSSSSSNSIRSSSASNRLRLKGISGNGTAAHPWNCADEFELMPTRNIQNQTGGIGRGISSNGTYNTTAKTSTTNDASLAAYPSTAMKEHNQHKRTSSASSATKIEDEYDKYGYSDRYPSNHHQSKSSINPTAKATTNTTTKEDAYQRYLQQKEKTAAAASAAAQYTTSLPTSRSASPGSASAQRQYDALLKSRSASPGGSTSVAAAVARSRSPSLERYYNAVSYQSQEEEEEEETVEKSAAANAKEMRAKRLATQKTGTTTTITGGQGTEDHLRLQSHNPAVQAYLARKEKERAAAAQNRQSTTTSSYHHHATNDLPPRRRASPSPSASSSRRRPSASSSLERQQNSSPSATRPRSDSASSLERQQRRRPPSTERRRQQWEGGEEDDERMPASLSRSASQRRQQRLEQQQQQQQRRPSGGGSGSGRPPAFQQPKSTSPNAAGGTTYTYQFQPEHNKERTGDSSSRAAAAITNKNGHQRSNSASATQTHKPLQSSISTGSLNGNNNNDDKKNKEVISEATASVTRARRLLQSSSSVPNNVTGGSSSSLRAASPRDSRHDDPITTRRTLSDRSIGSSTKKDESPLMKSESKTRIDNNSSSSHRNSTSSNRRSSTGDAPLSAMTAAAATTSTTSDSPRIRPKTIIPNNNNKAGAAITEIGPSSSRDSIESTTPDCSVTRARRLLLAGKGRDVGSGSSPSSRTPTIGALRNPPITTVASTSGSSGGGPGSQSNISSGTSSNSNIHSIPPTSGDGGKDQNQQNTTDTPSIPRPHLLQSIPSNLENDNWSVRVCVISAVDFPVHVVPNMPLSPVLKLGLVSIPTLEASATGKDRLLRDIDRKGLGSVSDQMRCTTTKLLSKRDNGAVEFHEELRWDQVALKPGANENLALAVELCARGVLRPANLHESPPPHQGNVVPGLSPLPSRAVTPSPGARQNQETGMDASSGGNNTAAAAAAAGGAPAAAAPMRPGGRIVNMFRNSTKRAKGKAESAAMESAQAAAAVAKLLVQGSTSPLTPAKDLTSVAAPSVPPPPGPAATSGSGRQASSQSAPAPQEWEVTLRKAPVSRASSPVRGSSSSSTVVMTDDIRLGSLLIPLTELEDLQRVLSDRSQPARLEKWFEVQNMNTAITNMNAQESPAATNPGRWLSRDRDGAGGSGSRSQSPANTPAGSRSRRNPSILLELSLYAPEVLDESEDEMDEEDLDGGGELENSVSRQVAAVPKSFAKRTTLQVRNQLAMQSKNAAANAARSPKKDSREEEKQAARASNQDPFLEPGIIDFISIVGARDIGDQKQDDGSKGWVQSTPECCVLEQFPPTDDFHIQQNLNRMVQLPQKVEWFCFPDGVKLWRGTEPPSASDFLSQQQQQQSSSIMTPSQIMVSEAESTSLALFDAYLNCTTSFNWFVIASNSEDYGSATVKTYGAVIRFYVPAPRGIDPTQDDFAQTLMMGGDGQGDVEDEVWLEQQHLEQEEEKSRGLFGSAARQKKEKKRLWVPIGICVTSSLPIVGIMEAVLMRSCEMLASRPIIVPSAKNKINNMIQRHLANLILNFQQPIAGAVNCSVPFLLGEPLKVRLPAKAGLPPLPHGNSVASVCRLLGPEGFIFVLAALLTESKILLHSHNTANTAMVAEVMTALLYPFSWSLPYIPVLPMGMLEFVEAPLSYLLGIPSSCLEQNMIDPMVLEDVVVVDLDNGFSSPDWKTTTTKYKSPTPLPSLVASNISRAVYRLLRALENEHDFGEKHSHPVSNASDRLPRIQPESKAEREFRIAIALEMGGLVRGYQDCLVFVSTSQPVFNREKFLKRAPALFIEEPSGGAIGSRANKVKTNRRILSSRSKRFLSILVNCQHFHQFLEMLRSEECAFFHEVMEMWIKGDENPTRSSDVSVFESSSSFDHTRAIAQLSKTLLALDEKISSYEIVQLHSSKPNGSCPEDDILQDEDYQILSREQRFPRNLLQQIDVGSSETGGDGDGDVGSVASKTSQQKGVHHASLSVQYLVELEKNPWRYKNVLDISVPKTGEEASQVVEVIAGDQSVLVTEKVKLRDAIGDRKFRAWKMSKEQVGDEDHSSNSYEDALLNPGDFGTKLDLASLMTSATEDTFSETSSQSSLTSASAGSRTGTNLRSGLTPEQQRVANAKDRDVLRRCLEKAYAAKPSQQGEQDLAEVFNHHGRDLVSEAEVALRNPSAQHFLLSLLSKRSKVDAMQKQTEGQSPQKRSSRRQSNANSISSSRLEPIAFECVVRLCCAMLDSCMETKDYEPAYLLLCHTAGLFTLHTTTGEETGEEEPEEEYHPMYMTARIGLHPLFADLGLWQKVMSLHLAEKHSLTDASNGGTESMGSLPSTLSHSDSFENDGLASNVDDEKEYEAAVATLYEMLGYGIPAEELARFATKVSQECGWFSPGSERGQSLLLLARRLSMRRELAEDGGVAPGETGDLDIMQAKSKGDDHAEYFDARGTVSSSIDDDDDKYETVEIGWCHPAAPTLQGREAGARPSITAMFRGGGGGQQTEYMNRSAVTALATFGPSVVVSGGLDGGVFLAHTAPRRDEEGTDLSTIVHPSVAVRGIHLDWGSSGSRAMPGSSAANSADGEYGVGAVSCLAAATGAGGHHSQSSGASRSTKDVLGLKDEEDMIREMEDSRVVAGTTCGDLRIWSVKDVYAAIHLAQNGEDAYGGNADGGRTVHAGSETSSSFVPPTPTRRRLGGSAADSAVGTGSGSNNPFNRLKFSLRGRALSGHRGGVTCVDVPSHVYRPDSVVTGGADGLIKLWSLRTSTIGRRSNDATSFMASSSTAAGQLGRRLTSNRGGDALSVLSGHGGRVLCVKTAWHGDRLLSGGADRTIRIWDMMSGGKGAGASSMGADAACLHTLSGHFGWVTQVQYWGPNTIVSGSTDRSIALWDARVRNSPLFVLRHHHAPISDLLVGSRTDPLMVSSASDGTVTTWDFRLLSGSAQAEASGGSSSMDSGGGTSEQQASGSKHCKVVRHPAAMMSLGPAKFSLAKAGPTMLARGDRRSLKTVLSAGSDAIMREWDVSTGQLVNEWTTGHCDALSSLTSLSEASSNNMFGVTADSEGSASNRGTITSSWDGTIRIRKRVLK